MLSSKGVDLFQFPQLLHYSKEETALRYADYDQLSRAKHIRVKSWKFHSCNLSEFNAQIASYVDSTDYKRKWSAKKGNFDNILKCPAIKRSLKFTKRLRFNSKLFFKTNPSSNYASH